MTCVICYTNMNIVLTNISADIIGFNLIFRIKALDLS